MFNSLVVYMKILRYNIFSQKLSNLFVKIYPRNETSITFNMEAVSTYSIIKVTARTQFEKKYTKG